MSSAALANSGVSDERVSLPDGPGSIGGAGENLSAGANMGAMSYELPLELPEGFAGATPSLSLRYNSMNGNDLLGIGWELPLPHIERFTARGLPSYGENDLFAADGAQELVRVQSKDGLRRYRARFEGGFVRYTWHRGATPQDEYWEAEYPDGSHAYFGADARGQVVPAARATHPGGEAFRYMLVETVDNFAHPVRYHYKLDGPDDGASVGRTPLLQSVEYLFRDHAPRYRIRLQYEKRDDVLSNGLPGFDLRLTQRVAAIEVCTAAEGLDAGDDCPTLLRRYRLGYEEQEALISRLQTVEQYGLNGEPYPAVFRFRYSASSTPGKGQRPVVFGMGRLAASSGGGLDMENGLSTLIDINGDALPDVLQTDFLGRHHFYFNRLDSRGGQRFTAPQASSRRTAGLVLREPGVQVADLDGDGFPDLFSATDRRVLCNRGNGDWERSDQADCGSMSGLPGGLLQEDASDDPDALGLRFMDVNGDRRIDLLRTVDGASPDQLWVRDAEGYGPAQSLEPLGKVFDTDPVQLADLNGDGLLDAVEIRDDRSVWSRLHLGRGTWAPPTTETLEKAPRVANLSNDAELQDLNGDGRDDLVVVAGDTVFYALRSAERFLAFQALTSEQVTGDLPPQDNDTRVLFADMNASGTVDVVFTHVATGQVRVLELFPSRPNLLTQIDNGLGGLQRVEYGTSAQEQARDENGGGAPTTLESPAWRHKLPQPIQVVTAIERYALLTAQNRLRLERHYHHGFYDRSEKRYRGFEVVEEHSPGDDTEQSSHRILDYDVGQADPYRQGLLTRERVYGGWDKTPYLARQTLHAHGDCQLAQATPAEGQLPVRYLCEKNVETQLREGRPEAEWATLRVAQEYDLYGNVTRQANHGVVGMGRDGARACAPCSAPEGTLSGACGHGCLGDEAYTHTDYIDPTLPSAGRPGSWNLGRAKWITGYSDPQGAHTETLYYYDGPAFVGLPSGQLTRGVLTRACRRQSPSAANDCQGTGWVQSFRVQYDEHGNVVTQLDPLGSEQNFRGHRRSIEYDAYHLKPEKVRVFLAADGEPYQLVRRVEYDRFFYQPARLSRWELQNAKVASEPFDTHIRYDAFGRRSALILPGDNPAASTQEFRYELASPVSRIVVRGRSLQGEPYDLEAVHCVDGLGRSIQTRTRLNDGLYQVDGFHEVNPQGSTVRVYQAYQGGAACEGGRPDGVPFRSYFYDALGRIVRITEPDAERYGTPSETHFQYDPLRTTVFDPEDNAADSRAYDTPQRKLFDGLGRTVALERDLDSDGKTGRVRVLWDELGRLAGALDPGGARKQQFYDLLGQVIEVRDPNAGQLRFEYDAAGNLLSRTDARGHSARMVYDGNNRLLERFDPQARRKSLVRMHYDFAADCGECTHAEGLLVQAHYPLEGQAEAGRDDHGFDLRGRETFVARQLQGHRFVTASAHDHAGRVTSRRYPDATVLVYRYDAASRLTAINGLLDQVTYTPRGLLGEVHYANGTRSVRHYDTRGRLHELRTLAPDDSVLQGFEYNWTRASGLSSIADRSTDGLPGIGGNVGFEHDGWNRVTRVDYDAGGEMLELDFDDRDNLTRQVSSLGASSLAHLGSYRYGGPQPNAVTRAGALAFQHDVTGRRTDHQGTTLVWDSLGRLARAQAPDGRRGVYEYGAGQERVIEAHDGGITYHVGPNFEVRDGIAVTYARLGRHRVAKLASTALSTQVLEDENANERLDVGDAWLVGRKGRATTRQLRGCARRLLVAAAGTSRTFLHSDILGSLTLATSSDARVRGARSFYPFGGVRESLGHVDSYGFTGQRRDPTTGLCHFAFRELDSQSGRWVSVDPFFDILSAERLERWGEATTGYAYTAGRFDTHTDPTGLSATKPRGGPSLRNRPRRFATFRSRARASRQIDLREVSAINRHLANLPQGQAPPITPETVLNTARTVNPSGSRTNCALCAGALDARLAGRKATAPAAVSSTTHGESYTGPAMGMHARQAVANRLLSEGPGARAIVVGSYMHDSQVNRHAFNGVHAVSSEGESVVMFVDGQTGGQFRAANWGRFAQVHFFPTTGDPTSMQIETRLPR